MGEPNALEGHSTALDVLPSGDTLVVCDQRDWNAALLHLAPDRLRI